MDYVRTSSPSEFFLLFSFLLNPFPFILNTHTLLKKCEEAGLSKVEILEIIQETSDKDNSSSTTSPISSPRSIMGGSASQTMEFLTLKVEDLVFFCFLFIFYFYFYFYFSLLFLFFSFSFSFCLT